MARLERGYYDFLFLNFGCEISNYHKYYHILGFFKNIYLFPLLGADEPI
jgi:hypothetical protein